MYKRFKVIFIFLLQKCPFNKLWTQYGFSLWLEKHVSKDMRALGSVVKAVGFKFAKKNWIWMQASLWDLTHVNIWACFYFDSPSDFTVGSLTSPLRLWGLKSDLVPVSFLCTQPSILSFSAAAQWDFKNPPQKKKSLTSESVSKAGESNTIIVCFGFGKTVFSQKSLQDILC